MGEKAAHLLVMPRLLLAVALLAFAGCQPPQTPQSEGLVRAVDHDAFFLWAGVRPPQALARAKAIYMLEGEVRRGDNAQIATLRPATPQVRHAAIWLVVRAERLDWREDVYGQLLAKLGRWEGAGNRLLGLQIDFDAETRGLASYEVFLRDLRRRLPARYQLSITGLMDWSANGDPAALARLAGVVDEVVIQTYQGRETIPGYQAYMASLARLPLPYRIGLVEGGKWSPPQELEQDPEFRGYVVFLVNP